MAMKRLAAVLPLLLITGCAATQSPPELQFDAITLGDGGTVATAQPSKSESAQTEPTYESADPSASPEASESEAIEYATDRYAEIDIEDQSGDGSALLIEEIKISGANSFLVIYDSNGLVHASALVTPQSQPVMIKMQIPISDSQEMEAVLYLDDGDGQFNLNQDFPILDDENELVHEDFYYRVTNG